MPIEIVPLTDAAVLLKLNNDAVPDVNEITPTKAQWMMEHCIVPGLALLDGQPAGVVNVYSDDCGFDSDYYRWFTDRYSHFLYIDRVIVADWARGQGIARALYQAVERAAHDRNMAIVADVYSEPPNVPSLGLHRAMGFEEIGSQDFPDIGKVCAKFMRFRDFAKPRQP